jgi:hypothetical protein
MAGRAKNISKTREGAKACRWRRRKAKKEMTYQRNGGISGRRKRLIIWLIAYLAKAENAGIGISVKNKRRSGISVKKLEKKWAASAGARISGGASCGVAAWRRRQRNPPGAKLQYNGGGDESLKTLASAKKMAASPVAKTQAKKRRHLQHQHIEKPADMA